MDNLTVMVVDDNPGITRALSRLLGSLGCEVNEFTDPLLALEQFQNEPDRYDLVFSDQIMPGLSGQELLAKVREIRPEVTIILGSGNPIEGAPKDCTVLSKPYLRSELGPIIKKLIAEVQERKGGK